MEYVNVQYAVKHGLVKATNEDVDNQLRQLRSENEEQEWEIAQKRAEKALEHTKEAQKKDLKNMHDSQIKTGNRRWILFSEYNAFVDGIFEAIRLEELLIDQGKGPGPFYQMLKYKPGAEDGGFFAVNKYWWKDMCRILFGLEGPKGDEMRQADLTVYDGVPFASVSGRIKLKESKRIQEYVVIGAYWRDKIKDVMNLTKKQNSDQLKFLFNQADLDYYLKKCE